MPKNAVGVLSVPLRFGVKSRQYIRPREQEVSFTLMAN
jgi:hypothetical protein